MSVESELRAEVAALRQQLAVCSCGSSPMTYDGPEPDCPVHGAVRAFNEASAEIAVLRQQLDAAWAAGFDEAVAIVRAALDVWCCSRTSRIAERSRIQLGGVSSPVADDLRTDVEKWLDEADALLVREPMAGELVHEIMRRHILAQHLILRAQSQIARRSLTQATEES